MPKTLRNAVSWFEIPTTNLQRAGKFYESILDIEFTPMNIPSMKVLLFPIDDPWLVGGALVDSGGFHKPSATDGPLVYLNANPDVQIVLDKVEGAGGKILVQKTEISPEQGHLAIILDSEGNRIALHSIPSKNSVK